MTGALGWLLAVAAGLLIAWVAYPATALRWRPALMALRTLAVLALVAILLDLTVGSAQPTAPMVALDASASWVRGGDQAVWRAALDSANAAGSASDLILFGDSARTGSPADAPTDAATLVAPALQRAAGLGRRVVIVTDGGIDDADALQQAAPGSRLLVLAPAARPDRGIADIGAPAEARVGDTVTVQARVVADAAVGAAASLRWSLDGTALGESTVPALPAGGETVVEARVVIPAGDSLAVLRAVLTGDDAQRRNDTLSVPFRRGARQRVVIVSTAPDADVRDVASALRASSTIPTDAYYQIAPGRWLRDGALLPVDAAQVRAAVRGATLAVLHGDTTAMGAPAALGTRALLLLAPPDEDAPELLVRPPTPSPLQGALAGIVVESLPPLLASVPARGGVPALTAAPGLGVVGLMPVVSAIDGEVRRVVVTAAGYSRWRARGGVSEAAFQALVGAATDWLLGARGRSATPVLAATVVRAGESLVWRRGARDSAVFSVRRDGDGATARSTIRFGDGAQGQTPPLGAGIWRGTVDGSATVIAINASKELLPRPVTLRSGPLNGDATALRRGARTVWWLYLATLLLLSAEWLLRRRAGLR